MKPQLDKEIGKKWLKVVAAARAHGNNLQFLYTYGSGCNIHIGPIFGQILLIVIHSHAVWMKLKAIMKVTAQATV